MKYFEAFRKGGCSLSYEFSPNLGALEGLRFRVLRRNFSLIGRDLKACLIRRSLMPPNRSSLQISILKHVQPISSSMLRDIFSVSEFRISLQQVCASIGDTQSTVARYVKL